MIALMLSLQSEAFSPKLKSFSHIYKKSLYMSDRETESTSAVEVNEPDFIPPEPVQPESNMFDMNRRVRLGRSRDQEGKSNIWSIEPTMQVEEEEEGSNKNLIVGVAVIASALLSLPLFSALSNLLPDPSDF